jgi:3-hydroxyacyl-CoA dehydrogenase
LADALLQADLVHECAPEKLDLKRELLQEIDGLSNRDTVIASASSAITTTEQAGHLPGKSRCLVAHPGNPPYLIPVIEVVPAPFTNAKTVRRASAILFSANLAPVLIRREVAGFVFNRLQGALLREAYCLVRDNVADVEDIDRIVRDGLGLRWSVVGPFETVDLNTRGGIARHAKLLGPAYAAMGADRGQNDPWTPELVGNVESQRRALLPLDQWGERVRWRDRMLMASLACRRSLDG